MKAIPMKKIAAAVAAACALASGAAYALDPSVTPQLTVHMSGASAEDNALRMLLEGSMCDRGAGPGTATDTVDVFLNGGTGKAFSAVSCKIDNTKLVSVPAGFPTNPTFLLVKRSSGGSGMGVAPVADATPIANMVVSSGNCTQMAAAADGTRQWNCTASVNSDGTPGAGAANIISDAGLSDVEPGMFVGPNVPDGGVSVGKAQIDAMNIGSATAVVFGVPVSTNLRNALQKAEGLTVGADDEANMPSLSSRQIASLMNGGIKTWDQLKVNGVSLDALPGVTPPAGPTSFITGKHLVKVCRRTPGSGTQAQFNANFLHSPCTPNALPALRASQGSAINGPIVVENAGSGDLGSCLDAANGANEWAIGLQATEKNMTLGKQYRFIKVDGVAPTLANVMATKYFDWSANSMQWRKSMDAGADVNCANAQECTNKVAVLETIRKKVASPDIIKTLNADFVHPFGQAGYLALSSNGYTAPANGQYDPNNPVMNQTRTTSSGPDTCRVPQVNAASPL